MSSFDRYNFYLLFKFVPLRMEVEILAIKFDIAYNQQITIYIIYLSENIFFVQSKCIVARRIDIRTNSITYINVFMCTFNLQNLFV